MSGNEKKPRGLVCGHCGGTRWKTTHVRPLTNGSVRRHRKCRSCDTPLTTVERPHRQPAA